MTRPKPLNRSMYAYYSPDGYVQVRTIAETKRQSREMLPKTHIKTYIDYEKEGFILRKIAVSINPFSI